MAEKITALGTVSFMERPGVIHEVSSIGVPIGVESVYNPRIRIGGACIAWGDPYDNAQLARSVEERLGDEFDVSKVINNSALGFNSRHHSPDLSLEESTELEVEVGARLLEEAAEANGWSPEDVGAVLLGMTYPVCPDYTQRICERAGIQRDALKVSIHKACDGSVAALNLVLNPDVRRRLLGKNREGLFLGKKVLAGGVEGFSRLINLTKDQNAMQLFANGGGIIGLIPGETMNFLVGMEQQVFDEDGFLQVQMDYPHSRLWQPGQSMDEVYEEEGNHLRISGFMHEPEDGSPVQMAGLMGMVKLFVRNGVEVVKMVYGDYKDLMKRNGTPDRNIKVVAVHHANLKINQLKQKNLARAGIVLDFPWVIDDFGNVSAASPMIAFLRLLSGLEPGDHVMFDGYGAGTYYDCLVAEMAGPSFA